jgi:hypothetical protein
MHEADLARRVSRLLQADGHLHLATRESFSVLAALVRRLERVRAVVGNRARGRAETGIHHEQGVLNPS